MGNNYNLRSLIDEMDKLCSELDAAKADIKAMLWRNRECRYCKFSEKVEYSGANKLKCTLGDWKDCKPEWRGIVKKEDN